MPVTLRANCIGSLVTQALSSEDSGIAGEVVNTFPNSFYLKTANGELVFVTNRSLRSPITINLDSTFNLEHLAKPLDPVRVHGKELDIGTDGTIDLSGALSYQSQSSDASEPGPEFPKIRKTLRTIAFLLRIIDTSQSVLDSHALAYEGMADFVTDGIIPLRRSSGEGLFREAALKIVGLGSGFTPSGDDALGGFLAAYNSLAKSIGRAPILFGFPALQTKTSWISAKLLDYMQRLILDEQVCRIIDSTGKGDENSLILSFESLLPRGHTSGIDISAGTILALSLIQDIAFEKEETETVATELGWLTKAERAQ